MLLRAKMVCIYTFTAAMAALLGGFATENLPDHDAAESPATVDATPITTPEGWVVKEMHVRMPMVVPADVPLGLPFEAGDFPAPELAIPRHLSHPMPVPAWVPSEMVPHFPPQMNPWTAPQFDAQPEAVDPGSLKTQDRLVDDGSGGLMLVRERKWSVDGVPCQNIEYRALDGDDIETARSTPPRKKGLPSVSTPQAAVVGVGVSVDSRNGSQVYEYRQGRTADGRAAPLRTHVYSSVQGEPGRTVGVGISADSRGGVRVHRYHDGGAAR